MTVTAASGSWCPPSRPTSGSAKWRSCSMSSTTSSTCSWPSRRTRRCSGSSRRRRPRCTRPATPQGRPGPRSRRSTPTRLPRLISKGTVFCVAELHFQGVQQADPEPEKQKERHIRRDGEYQPLGKRGKKSFNFSRILSILLLVRENFSRLCTFLAFSTRVSFVLFVCLKSDVNCILVLEGQGLSLQHKGGSSVGQKIKGKLGVLEV